MSNEDASTERREVRAGAFVCVVGPSGAGKDTLIAEARRQLSWRTDVIFPRRIVTREASSFEDHDSLSREAFLQAEAAGAFAMSWQAHGLHYAIPGAVAARIDRGACAVCNLSRAAVAPARKRFGRVAVVLVTAPKTVIAERLAARARETSEAISARLSREAEFALPIEADLRIVNVGPVARCAGELVAHIEALLRGNGAPPGRPGMGAH